MSSYQNNSLIIKSSDNILANTDSLGGAQSRRQLFQNQDSDFRKINQQVDQPVPQPLDLQFISQNSSCKKQQTQPEMYRHSNNSLNGKPQQSSPPQNNFQANQISSQVNQSSSKKFIDCDIAIKSQQINNKLTDLVIKQKQDFDENNQSNNIFISKRKPANQQVQTYEFINDHNNSPTPQKVRQATINSSKHQSIFKNNKIIEMKAPSQIFKSKFFKLIYYINKFLMKMRSVIIFRRPNQLNLFQINAINDLSHDDEQNKKNNKKYAQFNKDKNEEKDEDKNESLIVKKFKTKYRQIRKKISPYVKKVKKVNDSAKIMFNKFFVYVDKKFPCMDAYSTFSQIIDYMSGLMLIFFMFFIPFEICYLANYDKFQIYQNYIIVDQYFPFFLLATALIKLHVSYYKDGVVIREHKKILSNFFQNIIWKDVLIYILLLYKSEDIGYWKLLFFIKAYDLDLIYQRVKDYLILKQNFIGWINLLHLLFVIIYVCHVFSCLWFYVAVLEEQSGIISWVKTYNLDEDSPFLLYANAFYYATVTMNTVGYGDFAPQTIQEKLFISFMIFIACGVFGYSINQVGSIIKDMDQRQEHLRQELAEVNKYMALNNVEQVLQNRVRKYLEFISTQLEQSQDGHCQTLSKLSKNLQDEISINVYGSALQKIQLFKSNFSKQFLEKLSLKMKQINYGPDEIIVNCDDRNQKNIFFIKKGKVEQYIPLGNRQDNNVNRTIIKILGENESFGQQEFFSWQQCHRMSYRSLQISQIFYITIDDFLNVIQDFPEDKEVYCFIKDNINYYHQYQFAKCHCNSCLKSTHTFLECPLLFYEPLKINLLQNYQKNSFNERDKLFQRREQKKQCLTQLKKYTQEAIKMQERIEQEQLQGIEQSSDEISQSNTQFSDTSLDNQPESKQLDSDQIAIQQEEPIRSRSQSQTTQNNNVQSSTAIPESDSQLNCDYKSQQQLNPSHIQRDSSKKKTISSNNMKRRQSGRRQSQVQDIQDRTKYRHDSKKYAIDDSEKVSQQIQKLLQLMDSKANQMKNESENNKSVYMPNSQEFDVQNNNNLMEKIEDNCSMKKFEKYFIHNNFDNVISQYEKYRDCENQQKQLLNQLYPDVNANIRNRQLKKKKRKKTDQLESPQLKCRTSQSKISVLTGQENPHSLILNLQLN